MGSEQPPNSNDVGAAGRVEFVRETLLNVFGFEVRTIDPVAYEVGFRYPYNNFVYAVSVERSSNWSPSGLPQLPGCQTIPADETTFIFRIPNPAAGYNDAVRVANEVAALSLAREALALESLSHLVPRVYGWNTAEHGSGWILLERKEGEGLLDTFPSFSVEDKINVLEQMADVLGCFQRFQLPDTVNGYGGLAFDEAGEYVSAALSTIKTGPFATYEEMLSGIIELNLNKADLDPRVGGWRDNGIRERLDEFLAQGLHAMLEDIPSGKILVHADFSIDNILFSPSTKTLTAVLDFDFAHIGSVADEFFTSFMANIGTFPSSRHKDPEIHKLRDAMLNGFPVPLPPSSEMVDWPAAKAWDDALKSRNLQRPANIPRMSQLADATWLSWQILPARLCNAVIVGRSTEEQLEQRKREGEAALDSFLADFGY